MKKIIHIHVPKTGGTWLNNTLKEYADEHFLKPPAWHPLRLSSQVHHLWRDSVWVNPHAQAYYDKKCHSLKAHQEPVGSCTPRFDDAMKVSICRNPFDYLVSCYHYQPKDEASLRLRKYVPGGGPTGYHNVNAHHGISSFEDYIKKFCDPDIQWAYQNSESRYNIFYQIFLATGRCGVDIIMRNEYLAEATDHFLKHEGYVDESAAIIGRPFAGVGKVRKQRDYRSFYTDELRELIEAKCLAELALFEYNFDGPINSNWCVDPVNLFYHPITTAACKNLQEQALKELEVAWAFESRNSEIQPIQHIYSNVHAFDSETNRMFTSIGYQRYHKIMLKSSRLITK